MARLIVGLVIGAALGFGAGWFVFDSPLESGPSVSEVEKRLLERVRAGGRDPDAAECEPRQARPAEFLCTVIFGLGSTGTIAQTFVATTHEDGRVTFQDRGF